MNKGLIYIPDISGFTKFVTQTEIEHSQHIITEVLNLILQNNRLDLKVSEIEGDAVLFYKIGAPISLNKIRKHSENIFIKFHSYLNEIESKSICQCGACQTISGLSLKFIVHYGELSEVKLNNFTNIMGSDVILAHRLLKNQIETHEYLLLTNSYITTQPHYNKKDLIKNREKIENFGEVLTYYLPLTDLKPKSLKPEKNKYLTNLIFSENFSIPINAPINIVHHLLTDNFTKLKWVAGIKKIQQDEPINRLGNTHTCVINNQEFRFESAAHQFSKTEADYIEKGKLKDITFYNIFKLKSVGEKTWLFYSLQKADLNNRGRINNYIYSIKFNLFKNKILLLMKNGLTKFKNICEERN